MIADLLHFSQLKQLVNSYTTVGQKSPQQQSSNGFVKPGHVAEVGVRAWKVTSVFPVDVLDNFWARTEICLATLGPGVLMQSVCWLSLCHSNRGPVALEIVRIYCL